ncbi:MAG TPA: HAD family hydrolase [Holophagaceae bacterium]|nr:HAD family hydrolase [Holophagaceae bacterium]
MIRAVVFDLWNTLAHSRGGSPFQRAKALLRPDQMAEFAAFQRDAMTRPYADRSAFFAAWRDQLGLDTAQQTELSEAFAAAEAEAELFPETAATLAGARALARLALLSNTQSFDLELLDRLGLSEAIRVRGLSAELGAVKPEPQAFDALAKRLGLFPGNLVMVGDSWSDDIEGALAAGWTAIWINRAGKPRPEHDPEAELVELPDLSQVPEVVERLQAGYRCSTCLG